MSRPKYNFSMGQPVKGDLLEDKVSAPSSIVTEVRPLQPEKAEEPIDVTLLPIVREVSFSFPLNGE